MPGGLLTDSSSMEEKKGRVETERKEQREQQWIVCEKVTRKKKKHKADKTTKTRGLNKDIREEGQANRKQIRCS